jgi:hypothetical protein
VSGERCPDVADPATVAEVVAELAEARSTWSRAEVAKAIARRLPPGLGTGAEAGREWIEATTAAVLAHPEVVTLSAPLSAEGPTGLRRRDGLPGHERHGAPRHTTRLTLAREGRVLDALVQGRHAGVSVVPAAAVERAARAQRLGADQTAALRRICQGGERLVCVVGPAGAGKTRMVRAARDAGRSTVPRCGGWPSPPSPPASWPKKPGFPPTPWPSSFTTPAAPGTPPADSAPTKW